MMMFFLLLRLTADAPPPPGIELTVYRSRDEVPPGWRMLLPASFDFAKEMLATRAQPTQRVALISAAGLRQEHQGSDLLLWVQPEREPESEECPPCRGVYELRSEDLRQKAPRVLAIPLFRVARSGGRVFEMHELEPQRPIGPRIRCPICTAP